MTELLTPEEVCQIFKIKMATLRGWTSQERIPVVRCGKKHGMVRYRMADIEAMIESMVQPINPIHLKDRRPLGENLRSRR